MYILNYIFNLCFLYIIFDSKILNNKKSFYFVHFRRIFNYTLDISLILIHIYYIIFKELQ